MTEDGDRTSESDDRTIRSSLDVERRTVLKLSGAAMVGSGLGAGTASADQHGAPTEFQGEFNGVNDDGTIDIMGLTADVADDAIITSPTTSLSFGDLEGESFPGRDDAGFITATAAAEGVTNDAESGMTVNDLFFEWEHVVVGPVTATDLNEVANDDDSNWEALYRGTFEIVGVEVNPVAYEDDNGNPDYLDPRLPLETVLEGMDAEVDLTTISEGDLVAAEGYMGNDGVLYAAVLESEAGDPVSGPTVAIDRAECDFDGGDIRVRVRGGTSETGGEAALSARFEDEDHFKYDIRTDVVTDDTGEAGEFGFDLDLVDVDETVESCPVEVRVEHLKENEDGNLERIAWATSDL